MAKRRGNGEGSISKYIVKGVDKGWRYSLTIGRNSNGKLIRKQFYGKSKKEVTLKAEEYKKQLYLGILPTDDKITLEQWYHTWLFDYKRNTYKPKTFEKYEGIYRNYIKGSPLGKVKLRELRAMHIQQYYNNLTNIENKPASTIQGLNTRLKPCLTDAEKQGFIQKNYCKLVTLPKHKVSKEVNVFTPDEQSRFINSIKGHSLEMLFLVALSTGLRKGELLGLKWADIDFNNNTLEVKRSLGRVKNQETKKYERIEQPTKNGLNRTVPIPINIVSKLEIYRLEQNNNKLKLGDAYIDNDYIFANNLGLPLNENRPGRNLNSILKKIYINPRKFHTLRHTYATRLFEAGIQPKTVQALLGHSDIKVTMDIYTHVMEEVKVEAVEKLNSLFTI